jgi:RNA recognition motif-containing protein
MCKEFGEISSVKAIIDKTTGECKGYGFVDFVSHEDAKRAVEQLKRRSMQAQFAKLTANDPQWKRSQEADPTNLYLQNLPKALDEKV